MRQPILLSSLVLVASFLGACGSDANLTDPTSNGAAGDGGAGAGTNAGGNGGAAGGGGDGGGANGGGGAAAVDPSGLGDSGAWCTPLPACDDAVPVVDKLPWKHDIASPIIASGTPGHRGRDLFLNPGDPQWVIGKFAYSTPPFEIDKDLKDEQVDIFLSRNCQGDWEHLGSSLTTEEDAHPTVEGVEDSGGHVYFEIPADKALGLGRHRIYMVVRGDLTSAEMFIEVVPKGTPIFVSDVDGTLTTYETEEFVDLLSGSIPDVNTDAPKAFQALVAKGFHPMYLTARPEFLVYRTREFLAQKGFPPGIVHTTLTLTGATGSAAESYKTGELSALAARGLDPTYGFGNTDSDGAAYDNIGIQPKDNRVFFQFDDPKGGRRIESYTELLSEFDMLAPLDDCGQP